MITTTELRACTDERASSKGLAAPQINGFSKEQVGAAVSKLISASIGELAVLMSRTPDYKDAPMSILQSRVIPPVLANQFYVAEAVDKETGHQAPVAAITWAAVADDFDQRLEASTTFPLQISPDEWAAGPHIWIMDILGDPRGIGYALKVVVDGPLKDKPVKIASRNASGGVKIDTIGELLSAVRKQRGTS